MRFDHTSVDCEVDIHMLSLCWVPEHRRIRLALRLKIQINSSKSEAEDGYEYASEGYWQSVWDNAFTKGAIPLAIYPIAHCGHGARVGSISERVGLSDLHEYHDCL